MKTIKQFKEIEKDILQIESLTQEIIEIEKLAMDVSNGEAGGFLFELSYDEKKKESKDSILDEDMAKDRLIALSRLSDIWNVSNLKTQQEDKSTLNQKLKGYEVLYVLGALLDIKNKQRTALIKRVEDSGIQM